MSATLFTGTTMSLIFRATQLNVGLRYVHRSPPWTTMTQITENFDIRVHPRQAVGRTDGVHPRRIIHVTRSLNYVI